MEEKIFPYLIKITSSVKKFRSSPGLNLKKEKEKKEKEKKGIHCLHYNYIENCKYSLKHDLFDKIYEMIFGLCVFYLC